jgi:hypothetical protein
VPCTSRSPGCSLAPALLSSLVLWLLIASVVSVLAGLLAPAPLFSFVLPPLIASVVSVLAGLLAPLTLYVTRVLAGLWTVSNRERVARRHILKRQMIIKATRVIDKTE